jgi:hypothetical protein
VCNIALHETKEWGWQSCLPLYVFLRDLSDNTLALLSLPRTLVLQFEILVKRLSKVMSLAGDIRTTGIFSSFEICCGSSLIFKTPCDLRY